MAYDPARHRRRSIRLPHYDYAAPGRYFVTVCAQHRDCLFGEVEEDTVRLSEAGRIVQARRDDLPAYYPRVRLDAFVIMPNHVHGIIGLTDLDGTDPNGGVGTPLVGALPKAETSRDRAGTRPAPTPDDETSRRNAPCGLGVVVGSFKSTTTNAYIRGIKDHGWPPLDGRLWQRNYWERVLRTDHELGLARDYILQNPLRWHLDRLNENRRRP